MIISNLHKEPTALDTVVHRDLRLDTNPNAVSLISNFTSFAITISEFADAGRDYPILFVRAAPENGKEAVAPVAVFGLKQGENLFVQDGQFTGSYLPAMFRSYPFTMARIENSDRWALVFDSSWKGLSRTEGQPLFDDKGEATEVLKQIHTFVQHIETDLERTRQACAVLIELKLLKPMRFDAQLANGESISVDGFMTVDEEALAKLDDKQVVGLYRNGLLNVLHTHQLSLGNMRRLIDRRVQLQNAAKAN